MHSLLLFNGDTRPFKASEIERLFRVDPGFHDVCFPADAALESQFVEPDSIEIVTLSHDLIQIAISGTSETSLRVALLIQRHLNVPLRMCDTRNSFDIVFQDVNSLEELKARIRAAQEE